MIRFFLLLLACMAGTWFLADAIKDNGPGYVYIAFGHYSLETSAWFGLLLLAGLVAGLYLLTRLLVFILARLVQIGWLPRNFLMHRARRWSQRGVLAYVSENWLVAGKQLGKAARYSETPFLDYLLAARACLAAGDTDMARRHADKAAQCADVDVAALALLQMDVAVGQAGSFQQQFLLEKMLAEHGYTPGLLGRAIAIYTRNAQWEKLQALMPAIKRQKILEEGRRQALQAQIEAGLGGAGQTPTPWLQRLWQKAGKALAFINKGV